jgi:AraC family transcriptional regulator of adaptative response/methylated-DNA-[protein]-cysteine methyltransferase
VRQLLARVENDPTARLRDGDLRRLSIDPARARRYFQRHHGMTFHAYQRARRLGDALIRIRRGDDLNTVALGHGYDSPSGFRDAFTRMIGRPPGKSRQSDCIVTTLIESPLGPLLAAATNDAACLLEFTDRRALEVQFDAIRRRFDLPVVPGSNAVLARLRRELSAYFAGSLQAFAVPLIYPGTPFQEAVWNALRRIPFGETISYEDLAHEVGRPGACRAVGTANGANRIAVLIPCHRVVNKDGKLGGYGGGLWRKRFLLDLEAAAGGDQSVLPFDAGRIPAAG